MRVGSCSAAILLISAATMEVSSPAVASMGHPAVVIEIPVDYTPWLVATTAVPKPQVDAIAQVGSTIFAGGRFDRVAHPGGAPRYSRNN